MCPVSIRDTFDADQPSSRATSLPGSCAPTLASRNSRASRRSRTDGGSGWFTAVAFGEPPGMSGNGRTDCEVLCNIATMLPF